MNVLDRKAWLPGRVRRSFLHRSRVPYQQRETWWNNDHNQKIVPLQLYKPTRDEIRQIVLDAETEGTTVRAVGSGHSLSDAALGAGKLLLPDNMQSALDLEE